jgi:hypothetical protein
VLDEYCCCEVQVQVGGEGAGPTRLPQGQHLQIGGGGDITRR